MVVLLFVLPMLLVQSMAAYLLSYFVSHAIDDDPLVLDTGESIWLIGISAARSQAICIALWG